MVMRELVGGLPLEVKLLERHEFSSQTFVPLDVGRWLVVVCPHATLAAQTSPTAAPSSPVPTRASPTA
ncbi:MAG TPA: ureidoglycolate lyase [Xanthobacteraceae bacterium]|nr:ureidoglycolate lyase [Xanthobacteraceae bacterium]